MRQERDRRTFVCIRVRFAMVFFGLSAGFSGSADAPAAATLSWWHATHVVLRPGSPSRWNLDRGREV
jgi:hypothetical protein